MPEKSGLYPVLHGFDWEIFFINLLFVDGHVFDMLFGEVTPLVDNDEKGHFCIDPTYCT
jgi:hypothetical protein